MADAARRRADGRERLAYGGWIVLAQRRQKYHRLGDGYDVALTDNFKARKFGEIDFHNGKAVLTVSPGVEATSGGKSFTAGELTSDEKGKPTAIKTGSQTFYLIKREDRFGIRLKDSNSKERREFTHLNWYKIDPAYRVCFNFTS